MSESLKEHLVKEPLTHEDIYRFSYLPIEPGREDIIDEYKRQQLSFWVATQIDMKVDKQHWEEGILYPNTTNADEIKKNEAAKKFITLILAFFSGSDVLVLQNLDENFIGEMKWLEVKAAYGWQCVMEMIHSEAYSIQINELISNSDEKNELFNAIYNIKSVADKAEWVYDYMDVKYVNKVYGFKSLAVRLVAFAAIEGIMFSGEFAAIFWLRRLNRMPGLAKYNDLISKDEGMHTDFACLLYRKYIVNKLTEKEIHKIVGELAQVEIEFITNAISCDMIGMNRSEMSIYIKFVANRLLIQLGYNEMYKNENDTKIENPFPFMELISLSQKSNFFEGRPTNYNLAITSNSDNNVFTEDADF